MVEDQKPQHQIIIPPKGKRKKKIVVSANFIEDQKVNDAIYSELTRALAGWGFFDKAIIKTK
ncbi:MAG: hypothetical protein NTZ80_00215 [Patescibacteria group bacterium]|nr:hypothetical protein [Patescibacteria group bacterium]